MKQTNTLDGLSLELEPHPVESVSSASYYLKGGAVILGTGALYAVAKTTGVLSWLWSGIEAYTTGATASKEKALQTAIILLGFGDYSGYRSRPSQCSDG